MGDGACTRYDSAALTHVPPTYSHLSGLIDLFKSKIGPNVLHAKIIVSARFEYTLAMWREELKESASSVDAILSRPGMMPMSYRDPIKALHLSTLWPQFREDAVSDNAVFSELDPMTAPTWALRMEVEPQRPKGALGMRTIITINRFRIHIFQQQSYPSGLRFATARSHLKPHLDL